MRESEIYYGIVMDEPKTHATPEESRAWFERNFGPQLKHRAALTARFIQRTGCVVCGRPNYHLPNPFPAICTECDVWQEQLIRRVKWRRLGRQIQ